MRWLAALVLMGLAISARAHDVPPSVVQFDIGRAFLDVELQLPLKELRTAASTENQAQLPEYVLRHLRLSSPTGEAFKTSVRSAHLLRTDNPHWLSNDWFVVNLRAQPPAGVDTERFALDYDVILATVVSHKALVYVRRDVRNGLLGESPQTVGLIAFQQTHLDIDGSAGSWWKGFVKLWQLGVAHIATGTDHLMFILVLLLPSPLIARGLRWTAGRPMAESLWMITRTVSGFTIGHSITLALGALGIVTVPERPVEVLIAASILVSAVHAWRPLFAGREIFLAVGFGLIHGLAFATTLQGLSFDTTTLVTSLLGFNLGIECMQLAVIACVMPVLLLLSRTRSYEALTMTGACIAAVVALSWTVERWGS